MSGIWVLGFFCFGYFLMVLVEMYWKPEELAPIRTPAEVAELLIRDLEDEELKRCRTPN